MKVVGVCVDNNCSADYLLGRKAVGDIGEFGCAVFIGIKGRHISRVAGVRAAARVIMSFCICKGVFRCTRTAFTLVNVHCEDMAVTFFPLWQAVDRDCHHSFSLVGDKCGIAVNIGIFSAAVNNGFCVKCIYKKHLPYSIIICGMGF